MKDVVLPVAVAIALAFLIQAAVAKPYEIPTPSMEPTILAGDRVIANRVIYEFRDIERKDIIVFHPTLAARTTCSGPEGAADETPFVKRVIGLPGDRIQMMDGILHINGEAVKKERIEDFVDQTGEGGGQPVPQYIETLPNGIQYHVLDTEPHGSVDNTDEYVVPDGHYFMMGDNRDNSQDSRYLNEVGYVPIENYVGRADIIFFSISPDATLWKVWQWPFDIRWNRFFNLI